MGITVVIPMLIALQVSIIGFQLILSYFLILDTTVSALLTITYIDLNRRSKVYLERMEIFYKRKPADMTKYRIAALIPVFNEDVHMVAENAVTAGYSVWGFENVFILDDSTDLGKIQDLKIISEKTGFNLVRRNNRRGFKAGAINDWLKVWKDKYDYVFVLDADQRPIPGSLDKVMTFFTEDNLAYIQFPQYYSRPETYLGLAAWLQQVPFLRVIMKGRNIRRTPFVLGSGVLMKIKPLMEVGGFYEKSVTEDIFTSVLLQEKGYKGRYVDFPAIWEGQAPNTYLGYWTQQGRWSLGAFQLLPKLLSSRLKLSQFWDFVSGGFYWLKTGLLALVEISAPVLYLVFGIPFFIYHATTFFILYMLLFVPPLVSYLISLRKYGYKFKEFLLHQGIQAMDAFPTSLSLFSALSGKERPFKVTPKGIGEKAPRRLVWPIYLTLALLGISILSGLYRIIRGSGVDYALSIAINIFWASWMLVIFAIGLYLSNQKKRPPEVVNATRQLYNEEFLSLYPVLYNAMTLESSIGLYYSELSDIMPDKKIRKLIIEEAKESMRHADTYRDCMIEIGHLEQNLDSEPALSFAGLISEKIGDRYDMCIKNAAQFKGSLDECVGLVEELLMGSMAQFSIEVLRTRIDPKNLKRLSQIFQDERDHFRINLDLLDKLSKVTME